MSPLVRYWLDVADRALRTGCQTAGAMLAVVGVGVLEVDWRQIASVSLVAALASVLTSMGAKGFGADLQSAALVGRPTLARSTVVVNHADNPASVARELARFQQGRHRP